MAMGAREVCVVVMVLNWSVALAKLLVGYGIASVSLIADGYHSLVDGLSNVVGLIGISVSTAPPDEGHPYGHRKFETIAALLGAILILFMSLEVLRGAGKSFGADVHPTVSVAAFVTLVVTFAINLAVAAWEHRRGLGLHSDYLVVDSHHTYSDALVTTGVFLSLVATRMGYPALDPLMGGVVGLFIGWIGVRLLLGPIAVLADAQAVPVDQVTSIVSSVPGVSSCHKIRSRGRSDQFFFMELHIQVDPELTVRAGHSLSHTVKARLMERWPTLHDAVIHVEPDRRE
jgi:cation diffusion facilitator family transporter